jgi:aspartyl-tRNA(Asn)/glutamyl-tRNA(Gln) amidotransferase subunit A
MTVADMSAAELIECFRRGTTSPTEAVQALLERAEQHRHLNALMAVDAEASLTAAKDALVRYRQGRARPLEGVPVLVKDLIDTAGLETTYGSAMFAGYIPERDAIVVERVKAAGGIVIGKTATHEFAWGITTDGTAAGPARNPWNPELVPGGSSGGSAAGLAVGLAPLAIGTDTAGSIRIPTAFCGVTGLRPTFGLVPGTGVFPLAPSLDTVGPMARTVADLELLLQVIAGPTAKPSGSAPVAGVLAPDRTECAPDIARVFNTTVVRAAGAGIRIVPAELGELPAPYPTLSATVGAEAVMVHRRAGLWPKRAAEYHPTVRRRLEQASAVDASKYVHAQRDRALVVSAVARVFSGVDILLSPVAGVPPAPVGRDEAVDADRFRERVISFNALQSLAGVPACVVRAGSDDSGMPVGIQLTAAWGREQTLLTVARLLAGELARARVT